MYICIHEYTSNFRRVFSFYLAPKRSMAPSRCLHCSVKGKHLRGTSEVLLELLGIDDSLIP